MIKLKPKNKGELGFSLIELLIVISIIGIISFISIGYIKDALEKNKVVQDVQNMYGLLQEGRMKAFAEKKKLEFYLDIANKKACIRNSETSPPTNIKCVNLETIDFSMKNGSPNPIKIDKRGTFQKATIYYTGNLTGLSYDCIVISTVRAKMGVWDGSDCKPK